MRFVLSLQKGHPRALIKGGSYNGNIIYVCDIDQELEDIPESNEMDLLLTNFYDKIKGKLSMAKLNHLHKCIMERNRPANHELSVLYDQALEVLEGRKGKEIILREGEMKPIFDTTSERQVFYVTGMSGSGKSTYAASLVDIYQRLYPKNDVFVFSNKPEDPALDQYPITRIDMDETLYLEPLDLESLRDSLVIFDDVEAIFDKELAKEIDRLKDLILQQGRSYHVSMVYISHLANDYKRTRIILAECHNITVFPQMVSPHSLQYVLGKYFGLDKSSIEKICKLPSRWVTVWKAPTVILHEKGSYLPY